MMVQSVTYANNNKNNARRPRGRRRRRRSLLPLLLLLLTGAVIAIASLLLLLWSTLFYYSSSSVKKKVSFGHHATRIEATQSRREQSRTTTQKDESWRTRNSTTFNPPPYPSSENRTAVEADDGTLPVWMKDYFRWHKEQRALLGANNIRSFRFLVARCLEESDVQCGGVSDRLKSVPTLLRLAASSQRILLIHWTRPAPLEEFLLPVEIDWTTPAFLNTTGRGTQLFTNMQRLQRGVHRDAPIIVARVQDQHGGSSYYNRKEQELRGGEGGIPDRYFRKVFRSLFHALFEPSPAVRAELERHMSALQLVTGRYVAAHVRARYGSRPLAEQYVGPTAVNAVNCASQLVSATEGGAIDKVLFLSDSDEAVQAVERYRQRQNLPVVTTNGLHDSSADPLHLDKAQSRVAADYYRVFVDLYLLANAQCVSHGQGGFGRFGVLLSNDAQCFNKYIAQGRFVECKWKNTS